MVFRGLWLKSKVGVGSSSTFLGSSWVGDTHCQGRPPWVPGYRIPDYITTAGVREVLPKPVWIEFLFQLKNKYMMKQLKRLGNVIQKISRR